MMANLTVAFNGMALIGHGNRGEAFLVDTYKVRAGDHVHKHNLKPGPFTEVDFEPGTLIWFESGGKRLQGPLDVSAAKDNMIDLDYLQPQPPVLQPALLDTEPVAGGPWTQLLHAWIRLPAGKVTAHPQPFQMWPFTRDRSRVLTELITLDAGEVDAPELCLASPQGKVTRTKIPLDTGRFVVTINTLFAGKPHERVREGQELVLDELGLLYGCLTVPTGDIPIRFATDDDISNPTASSDLTICPQGAVRFRDGG
jgi:hypothetical protein